MHRNSELLFRKYAARLLSDGQTVLEIGPEGERSLHQLIAQQLGLAIDWQFTDFVDRPGLRFLMGEYSIPQPACTYDVVLAAQVIEHVRNPWLWMQDLARVCKYGGQVVLSCPGTWPYHEQPVDCWRMYPEAFRALHEEAGLETVLAVSESLDGSQLDTIAIGVKHER